MSRKTGSPTFLRTKQEPSGQGFRVEQGAAELCGKEKKMPTGPVRNCSVQQGDHRVSNSFECVYALLNCAGIGWEAKSTISYNVRNISPKYSSSEVWSRVTMHQRLRSKVFRGEGRKTPFFSLSDFNGTARGLSFSSTGSSRFLVVCVLGGRKGKGGNRASAPAMRCCSEFVKCNPGRGVSTHTLAG